MKNIKLPFQIKYTKVSSKKEETFRDEISQLELRWFVNLASIRLRDGKFSKEGFEVEVGSYHSGFYKVEITLDKYAYMYNLLKEIDKNNKQIKEEIEQENE